MMDERKEGDAAPTQERPTVERRGERELVVTRTINGPARLVFEDCTKAELFRQWWVPRSFGLSMLSCVMDVRVGGEYRVVFPYEDSTMEFFGTYVEVVPDSRLVWTNEESDGGVTVTTVTFNEVDGRTVVAVHDLYPSKDAADAAAGSTGAMPEALEQLDELLVGLASTNAE